MMAVDPVCKTYVDELEACSADHEEEIYFFCCEMCKQVFQEDPELFTGTEFNNRRFTYTKGGEVTLVH